MFTKNAWRHHIGWIKKRMIRSSSKSKRLRHILVTLKNCLKPIPRKSLTNHCHWLKMLKILLRFQSLIVGANGTSLLTVANGICQPTWSMLTTTHNKTKLSFQLLFYKHHFTVWNKVHLPTMVVSEQRLPTKFLTPLIPTELHLTKMVA